MNVVRFEAKVKLFVLHKPVNTQMSINVLNVQCVLKREEEKCHFRAVRD